MKKQLAAGGVVAGLVLALGTFGTGAAADTPAYTSPYQISGTTPEYTLDLTERLNSYTPAAQTGGPQTTSPGGANWYNLPAYGGDGIGAAWGPSPYTLAQPSPGELTGNALTAYYQQRVIATANLLLGTAYQHQHLPTWNPYANGYTEFELPNPIPNPAPSIPGGQWPWNPVSNNAESQQYAPIYNGAAWVMTPGTPFTNPYETQYGQGAAGIDCSDLTALNYSVAAGIYINSAVGEQGVANAAGQYSGSSPIGWNNSGAPHLVNPNSAADPLITPITPQFFFGPNSEYDAGTNTRGISAFNTPGSLDSIVAQLQPGDLLYITNTTGAGNKVTHVVTWLGQYGTIQNPSGGQLVIPLVISSHDNTPAVLDANNQNPALGVGNMPPPGVQILPFAQNNWFYSNFSHAMRILPTPTPAPTPAPSPTRSRPSRTEGPVPTPAPTPTPTPSATPTPSPNSFIAPGITHAEEGSAPTKAVSRKPANTPKESRAVRITTGKLLNLTITGLNADTGYTLLVKAGKKYWNLSEEKTNNNGEIEVPLIQINKAGTYTIAVTNTKTKQTQYVRIAAQEPEN